MLYKEKIKCEKCEYTFKGRQEAKQINYRCNKRLSQRVSSCINSDRLLVKFTFIFVNPFNLRKYMLLY